MSIPNVSDIVTFGVLTVPTAIVAQYDEAMSNCKDDVRILVAEGIVEAMFGTLTLGVESGQASELTKDAVMQNIVMRTVDDHEGKFINMLIDIRAAQVTHIKKLAVTFDIPVAELSERIKLFQDITF